MLMRGVLLDNKEEVHRELKAFNLIPKEVFHF